MNSNWQIMPVEHRGEKRLLIIFENRPDWTERVRKLVGVRWSKTHKAWHVIDNTYYRNLFGIPLPEPVYTPNDNNDYAEGAPEKIAEFTFWMRSRRYSESTIGVYTDALKTFFKY